MLNQLLTEKQRERRDRWEVTLTDKPEYIDRLPEKMRHYVIAEVKKCQEERRRKLEEQEEICRREEEQRREEQQREALRQVELQRQKARENFAQSRLQKLTNHKEPFLPQGVVLLIVVLTSGLIFGAAAREVAKSTGASGPLAAGAGFLGGCLAGFLVDDHGKRVFTGLAMKDDYNNEHQYLTQRIAEAQNQANSASEG